jgi:hypothetical protein
MDDNMSALQAYKSSDRLDLASRFRRAEPNPNPAARIIIQEADPGLFEGCLDPHQGQDVRTTCAGQLAWFHTPNNQCGVGDVGPSDFAQLWISSPDTRWNSRSLFVTRISLAALACAAIHGAHALRPERQFRPTRRLIGCASLRNSLQPLLGDEREQLE